MSDIEIARSVALKPIEEIAKKVGIEKEELECYGMYKAKLSDRLKQRVSQNEDGKLILVTAINPTPLGEGKTTISIGLADALSCIGKKAMLALREPSLGPVFGIKGGATGGGRAQVAPMEEINLHFTGDIHAITAANNLLAALIDNHIYFGNELGFETVLWRRCVDLNDRQLRTVHCGLSKEKGMVPREDGFDISVASEIMAILCLATDLEDLKARIGNIMVGYNKKQKPIYAKDLNAEGSLTVLLKDAIKPNLVQTLEHTPALIHGGPFANIAHGCNSIIATKMALKLSDYVVTEAGFGADLGAEKFLDIKCRAAGIKPDAVVIVATIKALKYHGGIAKEDLKQENMSALTVGIQNLLQHVENMKQFGLTPVIAINRYVEDHQTEIEMLEQVLAKQGIALSLVEAWEKGGAGAIDLAKKVVALTKKETKLQYMYPLTDSIQTKIDTIAKRIYGAEGVEYEEEAIKQIKQIEELRI